MTPARGPSRNPAWIAIWAGALLLFIWIAWQVRRGELLFFDIPVRTFVHAHAIAAVTALMRGLSQACQPAVLIGLGVLTILWLVRAGRGRTAVLFGVVVAGAEIIDQLGKHLFHRLRPVPFFGLSAPKSYSFPSGHALVSCAFFGALAAIVAARTPSRARRSIYYLAAAAFSGAIGLSRIYLGVHYPSDVLGGYAAAVVWACTVVCVMRRPPVRGT
ncbi:MAG: phosphatase PAP2 family protein [Bryobacteraceae bacterium]